MKDRPSKPYPEFPLYPHASGKWAKKIRGKTCYFGRWEDPAGALTEYEVMISGKTTEKPEKPKPEKEPQQLTIKAACKSFLAAKRIQQRSSELSPRTFDEYRRMCSRVEKFWGKSREIESLVPKDFTAYKAWRLETCNIVSVGNEVTRVKTMLKWLEASQLTVKIHVGPEFRKSSSRATRRHRRLTGPKLFKPAQIHSLIAESGVMLKAMIHLGINCAFGNTDCETINLATIEDGIESGWLNYPRTKTEVDRRCPLWPESIEVLKQAIEYRKRIDTDLPNAFLLPHGGAFHPNSIPIGKRFAVARKNAFIERGGFYWLRHTFATTASDCLDQVAINAIMGHVDGSMAAVYRHHVSDIRLRNASETVRSWLFGGSEEKFAG